MKSFKATFLIMLFLFLLCAATAAGCAAQKTGDDVSKSIAADTTAAPETSPLDNLPKTDLSGWEMKLLCATNKRDQYFAEEQNGETLNDAIYTTYSWVEETYNMTITVDDLSDSDGSYQALISKAGASGDDAYSVYAMYISSAAGAYASTGYFSDWNEIPYVNEHFHDLWWNDNILQTLKFKNCNYFLNGSLGYLTIGCEHAMLFNKKLFDDYGIAYPYQSVSDGTWTLDVFSTIIAGRNSDLNGDGVIKTSDDFYGFMSGEWRAPVGMPIACDLNTLTYGDDGYPVLNFYTEKTVDVYNKISTILADSPLCAYADDTLSQGHFKAFTEDRVLMISDVISTINSLRNMDDDFGIIPYPKYDEAQEKYISLVDAGVDTLIVPATNQNTENTGLITEALCEKAYENITPAYYDITLQRKSSRDDESEKMLELIRSSATFDALYVYNFGGLGFAFKTWIQAGVTDISSKYTALEKTALSDIEKVWGSIQ
jgi:hypothetical protein